MYINDNALRTIVQALVMSMLDYCHSLLIDLAACVPHLHKLQLVQTSAVRVISRTRKHEHI